MHTGRSLTVCWSLLPGEGGWSAPGGGVSTPGGVGLKLGGSGPGVVCSQGGVYSQGGMLLGGYIPACTEADTPPVDRQTPVKILPWPNFVAAGKQTKKNCISVRNSCISDTKTAYLPEKLQIRQLIWNRHANLNLGYSVTSAERRLLEKKRVKRKGDCQGGCTSSCFLGPRKVDEIQPKNLSKPEGTIRFLAAFALTATPSCMSHGQIPLTKVAA